MDIEKFVNSEAPHWDDKESYSFAHDQAYANELRQAFSVWGGVKDIKEIEFSLEIAREGFRKGGSTHKNVARCMILTEILKELKSEKKSQGA